MWHLCESSHRIGRLVAHPRLGLSILRRGLHPLHERRHRKKGMHRRFTPQAPCSRTPNFGELPQEVRRDRQAA
jgi:hypothetical protein